MEGTSQNVRRTVDDVFTDFKGRRAGLVKALTTDVEKFYQECDPEKENLCLYGYPNETWGVNPPVEEVPADIPEPVLGINFARDGMQKKDWLSMVAFHSNSWLIAVAFYFGAHFGFGKSERERLYDLIEELPTLFEVLNDNSKGPRDQSGNQNRSSKRKSCSKARHPDHLPKRAKMSVPKVGDSGEEDGDKDEDEQDGTLCGACGEYYGPDGFWICCDVCEKWFHGKCVKITPARAEYIKHYKCPGCSNKRARVRGLNS